MSSDRMWASTMALAGILYTTIAILDGEWIYATGGIGIIGVSAKLYMAVT